MKPKVAINKELCTGCMTCKEVCPMGVFEEENNKSVAKHESECIGCRACEAQCPENAIEIKFEES